MSPAALHFFGLKSFFPGSIFVVNITAFSIKGHRRFVLSELSNAQFTERKGTASQMEELHAVLFQSFPCS